MRPGDDELALQDGFDAVCAGLEALLSDDPAAVATPAPASPRLERLAEALGLDAFEQHLVLLAAGCELDPRIAGLVAQLHGDAGCTRPTFALALAALEGGTRRATTPAGPLRYWRILDPLGDGPVAHAPLALDERILDDLLGVEHLDERLAGLIQPWGGDGGSIGPSLAEAAAAVVDLWTSELGAVAHLQTASVADARQVAVAACAQAGLRLCRLDGHHVPADVTARTALTRLWDREAALGEIALLVEGADHAPAAALVDALHGPVAVTGTGAIPSARRQLRAVSIARPSPDERRQLWRDALGESVASLNGELDAIAAQFDIGPTGIRDAAAQARERAAADGSRLADELWASTRAAARVTLDDLAERLDPAVGWDDLVLPEAQLATLREMAAHVRRRSMVHEDWGFAAPGARGLGVAALFAGPSGTGKTLAAEVISGELGLDLFRIDLSGVVSKYVGETEKNLRRVFAAAEGGGAVLLFDEADALFGRRSEVRDSHDRYANIEVSYLLQRMEAYRGLAVLTTNMQEALDPAFLRRLRFVVSFPFPDAALRREIWSRVFPPAVPTCDLDHERLATLAVAGGSIRAIALGAAFLAADEESAVTMAHVERAARNEFAKLDRPYTSLDSEHTT